MAAGTETWGVPVVASVLDEHRKRLGLRPDPDGRRITESPYLTVIPEALEDPDDFGPVHAVRFREPRPEPRPLPNWWDGDERPLVYVTYGSVTPTLPFFPALFRATVAALGELPVRALFTVGVDVDVDALGPVPANVRIERWIPQADVMPHAAAMIGHGGAGSTRMALAAGVPSVIVPGFADQFRNAERVAALGAGLQAGPEDLVSALRRVLGEPVHTARPRAAWPPRWPGCRSSTRLPTCSPGGSRPREPRSFYTGPSSELGKPVTPNRPGPTWVPITGPSSDTNSGSRP